MPDDRRRRRRDGTQHLVTRRVAEGVVDGLEPVQVEVDDGHGVVLVDPGRLEPQLLEHPPPVGQPRQLVEVRQVPQPGGGGARPLGLGGRLHEAVLPARVQAQEHEHHGEVRAVPQQVDEVRGAAGHPRQPRARDGHRGTDEDRPVRDRRTRGAVEEPQHEEHHHPHERQGEQGRPGPCGVVGVDEPRRDADEPCGVQTQEGDARGGDSAVGAPGEHPGVAEETHHDRRIAVEDVRVLRPAGRQQHAHDRYPGEDADDQVSPAVAGRDVERRGRGTPAGHITSPLPPGHRCSTAAATSRHRSCTPHGEP